MEQRIITLTYFKTTGKYYTCGEYTTTKKYFYEIIDEVKEMRDNGKLPGICGCEWVIHVENKNPDNDFCLGLIFPNERMI
jgi:hypothetical protein